MKASWRILLNFSLVSLLLWLLHTKPIQAASQTEFHFKTSNLFYQGIEQINRGNYEQALANLTQVIQGKKSNLVAAAYSNRCLVYLQIGNHQAAKSDCLAAVQLNPENTEAYLNLGLAEYHLGNYPAALKQYQRIIERNQDDYRAYYNQGLAYFSQQKYEQALSSYQQALQLSHTSSTSEQALIYSSQGQANLILGQIPVAIASLTQAIILDSNHQSAYYYRACAYQKNGKITAAIADLSRVLQLNPHYAQAYANRGWLQHQIGLEQAAMEDLTTALNYFQQQQQLVAYQRTLDLIQHLQQTIAESNHREFATNLAQNAIA